MYKAITGNRGVRYTKNGRLIPKAQVPEDVIELLKTHASVEEPEERAERSCIFCGQETKLTKFLNLRTIYVCEQHYQTKTSGQIIQQLRSLEEVSNATQEG